MRSHVSPALRVPSIRCVYPARCVFGGEAGRLLGGDQMADSGGQNRTAGIPARRQGTIAHGMSRDARPAVARADVWFASARHASVRMASLLDDREAERLRTFRHVPSQRSYLVAAALLRIVAGRLVGEMPDCVRLDRTCPMCGRPHGPPSLIDHPWLSCSVSHSRDHVAVAFVGGAGVGVGVDVEATPSRHELDWRRLERSVLHPAEQSWINASRPETLERSFLVYWTRKEAVLKATGEGLRSPLTDVVTDAPDREPRLLKTSRGDLYERISLASLTRDRVIGHVAVAVPRGESRRTIVVKTHDASLNLGAVDSR